MADRLAGAGGDAIVRPSSGAASGPGAALRPEDLGLDALAQLVESSRDGIALLDEELRVIYMNPAGCEIVGHPVEQLIGRTGLLMVPAERQEEVRASLAARFQAGPSGVRTTIVRADGQLREIDYTGMLFRVDGRQVLAGTFRDTTEVAQAERWAAAFAEIASTIALSASLGETLDALAHSVVQAAGLLACGVILLEHDPIRLRVAGTHGLPSRYAERFETALEAGRDLPAVAAFEARQRVIVHRTDGGPFVRALEDVDGDSAWTAVAAIPMVARDDPVGVVKAFFGPAHPPDQARLGFLTTIADQAAMAVENARLFSEARQSSALEERQRLARDLHDSVSQALFSMTLQTRGAQLALAKQGIDPAGPIGRRLTDLQELAEGALAEMRMLILELRPGAMQEEGLVAALQKLAQGIAARDAVRVDVEAPADRLPLRPEAEEQLYRLTQEALTNVVKHARAQRVQVRLEWLDGRGALALEVVDDGVGFDPSLPRPGHLGLRTMTDRVESLGGGLEVSSRPGGGTRIRAVVPAPELRRS